MPGLELVGDVLALPPHAKLPGVTKRRRRFAAGGVSGSLDAACESRDVAEVVEDGSLSCESRPRDCSAEDAELVLADGE